MRLLALPNELLLNVAKSLDPGDVGSLIEACPELVLLLIPTLEAAVTKSCPGLHSVGWAARQENENLVEILLDNGVHYIETDCDPWDTALHHAATSGNVSIMRLLLDSENSCMIDYEESSIVRTAAMYGQVEVIEFLQEFGLDINQAGWDGQTALHEAEDSATVEFLLGNGAELELGDYNGDTPLMRAAKRRSLGSVAALLRWGADVDAENNCGQTAFHRAFDSGYGGPEGDYDDVFSVPRLLLEVGAVLDSQDNEGSTALHLAATNHPRVDDDMNFLLEEGADIFIQDNFGLTALQKAIDNGYQVKVSISAPSASP